VAAWPWQAERETDLRRAKAKGATVLAHRLWLYLALHEGADALNGRSRFRKDPRPDLPGVRHSRPYFEFDLDIRRRASAPPCARNHLVA